MARRHALTRSLLIGAAALLMAAGSAQAMFAMPIDAPVERLIRNMTRRLQENPKDAAAWYRLGRVHNIAYVKKWRTIMVFPRGGEKDDANVDITNDQFRWDDKAPKEDDLSEKELLVHLSESIRCISKAIELDPTQGAYYHSLASLMADGAKDAAKVRIVVGPALTAGQYDNTKEPVQVAEGVLAGNAEAITKAKTLVTGVAEQGWGWERPPAYERYAFMKTLLDKLEAKPESASKTTDELIAADWKEQATELYFKAMSLALPHDSRMTTQPIRGVHDLLTYQSAQGFLAAVKARGERPSDKARVAIAQATTKAYESVPPSNAITPIIFPLDTERSLSSLLNPRATTSFDLDATGRNQRWPWLRPDTGVLVWDPSEKGRITSGRQLFGSVTWWVFFDNGYQALDALDDNDDGELTGGELAGLGVWVDRNGDGVSQPGEVTPARKLGIAGISCRALTTEDGCPANRAGLRFTDGRVLPTYDWTTEPAQDRSPLLPFTALTLVAGATVTALAPQRRRTRRT